VAGTIEFERGQIVAKIGKQDWRSEGIFRPNHRFAHPTRTEWLRKRSTAVGEGFAAGVAASALARLLVLPI
jgi:hypothetical protein